MKKAASTAVLGVATIALAGGIYVGNAFIPKQAEVVTPVEAPHYVDKQAVINALSTKAQLVGLTGKVAKTITYEADEWYGDKTYKLAATGTFKLGVNTSDILVSTEGNTVTVKFPQPKIISVELPFDKAKLSKDVGMFRKDISEGELQALYGKARTSAIDDIKRNRQAFDKAEQSVERTIEALVKQVDGVKAIEIMEAK
jgi:hypothetical protein